MSAAGPELAQFSSELLVLFGLISMGVAAVFILGQADFKRMLAYSSVEHMGILALGIGIGGAATFGAMLHTVNHSLTKAMLFLAAGNIMALYRTKSTTRVRGLLQTLPVTGVLWLAGFLAIVGSPPFRTVSERADHSQRRDRPRPAAGRRDLPAGSGDRVRRHGDHLPAHGLRPAARSDVCGRRRAAAGTQRHRPRREPLWSVAPLMALGLAVLTLGVYVPPPLTDLLRQAAAVLGVH